MATPVKYVERPFAGERYRPDNGRLIDIALARSAAIADSARQSGNISALMYGRAGEFAAKTLGEIAQMGPAERARQVEAARYQDTLERQQRAEQLQAAEMEQRRQEREQTNREQAALRAEMQGDKLGASLPPGAITQGQMDVLGGSPEQGQRTRYAFGPGTAEGPELLPTAKDAEMARFRTGVEGMGGMVSPTGSAVMPPREPVAPREPNPTQASLAMLAAKGDKGAMRALDLIRAQRPASGGVDNEPLETIIGPDGKPVRVRRSDAVGKSPASGTEKPSSGVQKRVLNFFNRAEQADKDLEGLEAEIQQTGLAGQTRMAFAPNVVQSQTGQAYTQAQRAFTEARLRKDSGAAIPEQEFKNDRQTYFAQPGDSAETLQQKRRARAAVLASLAFESGQALGEFLGSSDEAAAVVQQYKTRAAKAAADPLGIRK